MSRRAIGVLVLAAVAGSACGGGDENQQAELADLFVESHAEAGFEVDRDCVDETIGDISDEDAALIIAAAGTEESAEVGDDAEALIAETRKCVDADSYLATIFSMLEESSVDIDCLRAELADAVTIDEINEQIIAARAACTV